MTELKPCPFCGVSFEPSLRFSTTEKSFEHNCRSGIRITTKYPEIIKEVWNSAYCWKRAAELETACKDLIKPTQSHLETMKWTNTEYGKSTMRDEAIKTIQELIDKAFAILEKK